MPQQGQRPGECDIEDFNEETSQVVFEPLDTSPETQVRLDNTLGKHSKPDVSSCPEHAFVVIIEPIVQSIRQGT